MLGNLWTDRNPVKPESSYIDRPIGFDCKVVAIGVKSIDQLFVKLKPRLAASKDDVLALGVEILHKCNDLSSRHLAAAHPFGVTVKLSVWLWVINRATKIAASKANEMVESPSPDPLALQRAEIFR